MAALDKIPGARVLLLVGNSNWFEGSLPWRVFALAEKLAPIFMLVALLCCGIGLYMGFFTASLTSHEAIYRIVFLHVPAAWVSLLLYVVMTAWAASGLLWQERLNAMMACAIAPTGALFSFLALCTDLLMGKPIWGEWWFWDARLTMELLLLFFYLGCIALQAGMSDPHCADRLMAGVSISGLLVVPLACWFVAQTDMQHGGSWGEAKFTDLESRNVAMLAMGLGFWAYGIASSLRRICCVMLERGRGMAWADDYVKGQ